MQQDQTEVENTTKLVENSPEEAKVTIETEECKAGPPQNESQADKKPKKKKNKKRAKPKLSLEAVEFLPTVVYKFDPTLLVIKTHPLIQNSTAKAET